MSENSAFTMTGVSASSGKSTKPTAASTSAKAFCISLPNLNSITELALPSKEVELTDFTFSIARNSGSNDWIMLESISSAVAPDHDIVMPIMDGYELVKNIKSNVKLEHVPVIALTSFTEEENQEKGILRLITLILLE